MEKEHLHLLIDEEIYVIEEGGNVEESPKSKVVSEEPQAEGDAEGSTEPTVTEPAEEESPKSKVVSEEPQAEGGAEGSTEKTVTEPSEEESPKSKVVSEEPQAEGDAEGSTEPTVIESSEEESRKSKVVSEEPQAEGDAEGSTEPTVTESSEEESRKSKVVSEEPQAEGDAEGSIEKTVVGKHTDENPNIPSMPATALATNVKYAFFHNTDQPEELDLLNKIIGACKLTDTDFKVLKVGQEIPFEKAVVFTKAGPSYYEVTNHEKGIVMYSQPLAVLLNSKEEKGRLWEALQRFVK